MDDSQRIWWVSFADEEGNRGLVITVDREAGDIVALARRLWRQGLNPGGEMLAHSNPAIFYRESPEDRWVLEPENMERLISPNELTSRAVAVTSSETLADYGIDREQWDKAQEASTVKQEDNENE